jgi:hypothetical protein
MLSCQITEGQFQGCYAQGEYAPGFDGFFLQVKESPQAPVCYRGFFCADGVDVFGYVSTALPILEKREVVKLHCPNDGPCGVDRFEEVQLIGSKVACGSVWCRDCYVRKGGSKRFSNRLSLLDWQSTRQIILTVDPKQFNFDGQAAYEYLKNKKALSQFVHNLKRTCKIKITDWVWNLEWHKNGFPHWHLFLQTKKGMWGMVGNANLLQCWKYGIPREEHIHSQKHWDNFTGYFGGKGYFKGESKKDKSHQLELPDWAKQVTYRIRKTGSKQLEKTVEEIRAQQEKEALQKKEIKEQLEKLSCRRDPKTYADILGECGQNTMCQIRRGANIVYCKFGIPYKDFREFAGEFIHSIGYVVQMKMSEFWLFEALYGT